MTIASSPSKLSLPQSNPGVATVLEYLVIKFPSITSDVWKRRMADGKVHWHDGSLIRTDSPFIAQQRVYYYREVASEPIVPFEERIIFQDELIVVAYKPHFLPVTPGGGFVEECLQNRLRKKTENQQLQAVHRLDRATAGLVLFSVDPKSRKDYHQLFASRHVEKIYQAIAKSNGYLPAMGQQWEIKNRIEKAGKRFLMHVVRGLPNSHSHIRCLQCSADKVLFELQAITGKTHQLRLHMQSLGWPILNDTYYPDVLQGLEPVDYDKPMQLLAQRLQFADPVTKQARSFSCDTELSLEEVVE